MSLHARRLWSLKVHILSHTWTFQAVQSKHTCAVRTYVAAAEFVGLTSHSSSIASGSVAAATLMPAIRSNSSTAAPSSSGSSSWASRSAAIVSTRWQTQLPLLYSPALWSHLRTSSKRAARRWHAVGSIRGTVGKVGPLTVPLRECSPLIGSNRGPEYQEASILPKRLSSAHVCSRIRRRDPQTVNMTPGVFVDDAVTSDLFE